MARTNLKIFRVKQHMTQAEFSEKIGYQRATYAAIEKGKRGGRQRFWKDLQQAFNIPDGEIWELMKND